MFGQALGGPVCLVDLFEQAHIAGGFGDKAGKLGNNRLLAVWGAFEELGDKFGYGHADATDLFGQGFDQQLQFFAQHAGHQPFERGGVQAVEHGERQGEGNAVERMVRLEAVAEFEFAVGVFPIGGELLFGNVRGGVLHEVVAGEEQQARVFLFGGFEPGLKGADVGERFGGGFVLAVVFRQAFIGRSDTGIRHFCCCDRFVGFENPTYVWAGLLVVFRQAFICRSDTGIRHFCCLDRFVGFKNPTYGFRRPVQLRQPLMIKIKQRFFVHQHILFARFVFQFADFFNQFFVMDKEIGF